MGKMSKDELLGKAFMYGLVAILCVLIILPMVAGLFGYVKKNDKKI